MLFIPLPFVVALLLVVLFIVVARRDDDTPANRPFLALILISALQSLLLGLRWGYGVREVMYLTPVIAATMPPLAYCGVARLVRRSAPWRRVGLHVLPALAIAVLVVVWRDALDAALILIFVGYAATILLLMRPGTDALRLAPFDRAGQAYRAIVFTAASLLLSSAVDTLVSLDMAWTHGRNTPQLISIANLAALMIIAVAGAAASRGGVGGEAARSGGALIETADIAPPLPPPLPVGQDDKTLVVIRDLMERKRVWRDADLNLDRLARKAGIPARQISNAINRAVGKNVSQYVNDFRIAEACRLLAETDQSVTETMLEVGFQTKSNFNREFRRVTDMTPLAWRAKADQQGSAIASRGSRLPDRV